MIGRTTCYFSGHVQGVGFRYTVMELSADYAVAGFVRNLSDGRVELVVEGESRDRSGLIGEIKRQMAGYIDDVDVIESVATEEFARFSIRH